MLLGNSLTIDENSEFSSLKKAGLSFEQVCRDIVEFIKADIDSSYRISVGTDSQVGSSTVFVSCIVIHRVGRAQSASCISASCRGR